MIKRGRKLIPRSAGINHDDVRNARRNALGRLFS